MTDQSHLLVNLILYGLLPLWGPWNLAQRFLMHGFFTEHLHARLERLRLTAQALS
jgi:hypothetical protein